MSTITSTGRGRVVPPSEPEEGQEPRSRHKAGGTPLAGPKEQTPPHCTNSQAPGLPRLSEGERPAHDKAAEKELTWGAGNVITDHSFYKEM